MYILYFMYICIYVLFIIYVYTYINIYIYIYYMGSYAHALKIGLRNQNNGQWQKNKMPSSAFHPADKKEKVPAFLQGLKYQALYTIAARGCIVAKRCEQCYNLHGVLFPRLGYNISRICPDSYKARTFRHFRQHRE